MNTIPRPSVRVCVLSVGLLLLVSCLCWGLDDVAESSAVSEAAADGGCSEAAAMLVEADRLREAGDWAGAIIVYVNLMDRYSSCAEVQNAYESIELCDAAIVSRGKEVEALAELEAGLPGAEEMSSTLGKYMIGMYHFLRANYLKNGGYVAESEELYRECCDIVLSAMGKEPDSGYHMATSGLFMESAKKLARDEGAAGAAELENYLQKADVGMAGYACHYVLADYYLHDGQDRAAAERHFAAMLSVTQEKAAVVTRKGRILDWVEALTKWADGYARLELGAYDDAIVVFDELMAKHRGVKGPSWGSAPAEWAAISKPMAIRRKHPGDANIAIEAYEDYLARHGESDYVDFAYLELGNLYTETRDFEKAEKCYWDAVYSNKHWEAGKVALEQLGQVRRMREESANRVSE